MVRVSGSSVLVTRTDPALGILEETAKVAPLIQTTPPDPSLERHFSAFALTSHLHSPILRLVSLHPSLSVTLSFLRVPEIHDGFVWKCFFSRNTTVLDVVEYILASLGLTKFLPVPGGGVVDYVLEEVWNEGDAESELHAALHALSAYLCLRSTVGAVALSQGAIFYDLFNSLDRPSTFSVKARRSFRVSVPDEWYRRSRPRSTSSLSVEPSESTVKAALDMDTSEEEGDGTAKQAITSTAVSDVSPPSKAKSADWRQSLSQGRLSSVFEGWLRPSTPTSPTRTGKSFAPERMSVSEPRLLERTSEDAGSHTGHADAMEAELNMSDFEQMLVCVMVQVRYDVC
jgi:diaphanous 1